MAGMSGMDKGEPQFPEARREVTLAYDNLATGGEGTTVRRSSALLGGHR